MRKMLPKLAISGLIIGASFATFGIWLMWSEDPEFHSGTVISASHVVWITGYSVGFNDIFKALKLYAVSIFYGISLFIVVGTMTIYIFNTWKEKIHDLERFSNK